MALRRQFKLHNYVIYLILIVSASFSPIITIVYFNKTMAVPQQQSPQGPPSVEIDNSKRLIEEISYNHNGSSTIFQIAFLESISQMPKPAFQQTRSCPKGTISYDSRRPYKPPKVPPADPKTAFLLVESFEAEHTASVNHRLTRLVPNKPKLTHQETRDRIRALLQYTSDQLDKWSISHQLFFGTLLGAYRHLDFIPWDSDADLLILKEDVHRLRETLLQNVTQFNDPSIQHSKYQWIVTAGDDARRIPFRVTELETGLYVDIFQLIPSTDRQIYEIYKLFGCFPHEVLFPLRPCVFGPHVYSCPRSPKAALILTYQSGLGIPPTRHASHMATTQHVYEGVVANHSDIPKAKKVVWSNMGQ